MAKKVTGQVKLQIPAGKATPAPPVGTALGPQGVNIMEFCKAFNAKTSAKDQEGLIIPVVITIFSDRSFTFITKTPPVPVLIKRAVNLAKGSAEPNKNKVGKITEAADRRDRQDQDARSELLRPRSRHALGQGHLPQHGRRRCVSTSSDICETGRLLRAAFLLLAYDEELTMPDNSFDVVSKIDLAEVSNAIQQASKEIHTRFDLKDSKSHIELNEKDNKLVLASADEYKLKAVTEILQSKLVKRNVPLKGLRTATIQPAAGSTVRQEVTLQQGITKEKASEIVKAIKDSKKKAQASIQGDLVRVSAKDRDILQEIIALLRGKDFGIDMQFTNYRTN